MVVVAEMAEVIAPPSRRVTKCSRAHRYDCVFGSGTTTTPRAVSRGDAFTKRSRTSGRYGSGGVPRTRGTVAITFSEAYVFTAQVTPGKGTMTLSSILANEAERRTVTPETSEL